MISEFSRTTDPILNVKNRQSSEVTQPFKNNVFRCQITKELNNSIEVFEHPRSSTYQHLYRILFDTDWGFDTYLADTWHSRRETNLSIKIQIKLFSTRCKTWFSSTRCVYPTRFNFAALVNGVLRKWQMVSSYHEFLCQRMVLLWFFEFLKEFNEKWI